MCWVKRNRTHSQVPAGILSAKLYLITLPYNFTLHLITNLTKPYLTLLLYAYHLSEHWTLFFFNSYIFVVCSIWCKNPVCCLLFINFVTLKVIRLPSSKAVTHFPTAVEVRFILLQNVGINRAFRVYKIPRVWSNILVLSFLHSSLSITYISKVCRTGIFIGLSNKYIRLPTGRKIFCSNKLRVVPRTIPCFDVSLHTICILLRTLHL